MPYIPLTFPRALGRIHPRPHGLSLQGVFDVRRGALRSHAQAERRAERPRNDSTLEPFGHRNAAGKEERRIKKERGDGERRKGRRGDKEDG